jgi:hypothetical protein
VLPSIDQCVHLVSGSAAAGQLMGAGARKRIYRSDDTLTSGPCDPDPARQLELRRAWDREAAPGIAFRNPVSLEDLRTAIEGGDPVVLWGTRAFSDLVWLWWALDGLRRIGAGGSRFYVARPHAEEPWLTVGHLKPAEVLVALAAARPVTEDEWREGARLWLAFASPSPLAFDEARRTGSSALTAASAGGRV